ncbi:hypothetical protein MRB53_006187 [Persea americana]|uniref:Uncharacterized protein n=1 Tax=Persea americana TaxID=3435 RepID=A0ACC2MFG7_PERAE|nr:hypothetical protein MRB53_006187 [Persea americana]
MDPSINTEATPAEETPTTVEKITSECPIQTSEVQDQSILETTSQVDAAGDSHDTYTPEILVVPEPSTATQGVEVATDDMARSLTIKSQVICTRAANLLEEQPEEKMDDSEGEREMDTSITSCNFHLLPFPQFVFFSTPDDASFELVRSLVLLKELKQTVRILLHKIFHILTSGNIAQLAYFCHAANNIFSMD